VVTRRATTVGGDAIKKKKTPRKNKATAGTIGGAKKNTFSKDVSTLKSALPWEAGYSQKKLNQKPPMKPRKPSAEECWAPFKNSELGKTKALQKKKKDCPKSHTVVGVSWVQ